MIPAAVILSTALIRTISRPDSNQCISQLIVGFNKITELVKKYPDIFDLYWLDNTIETNARYDDRLFSTIEKLPNLKGKKMFFENYYNPDGSANKGCGMLAIWSKILPEIISQNYKLMIAFEPRQEIRDYSFFDTFIKEPGIYFKTMRRQPDNRAWRKYFPPYAKREVWTGLFSCLPKVLLNYVEWKISTGLDKLVEKRFHLEGNFFNYLKNNNISFKSISNLGLSWHDNLHNRHFLI